MWQRTQLRQALCHFVTHLTPSPDPHHLLLSPCKPPGEMLLVPVFWSISSHDDVMFTKVIETSSAEYLSFFWPSLASLASMLLLLTSSGETFQMFSIMLAKILPASALYLLITNFATQHSPFCYVRSCCRLWELGSKCTFEERFSSAAPRT